MKQKIRKILIEEIGCLPIDEEHGWWDDGAKIVGIDKAVNKLYNLFYRNKIKKHNECKCFKTRKEGQKI